MIRPWPALSLLAVSLGAAAIAQAPKPAAAPASPATNPGPHNSNAPIDWEADRIEVQDKEHRATLIGNVHARQEDMTLTSDRAVANYTGSVAGGDSGQGGNGGSGPQVHRLDANGHVVVTRPTEVAHGNYGIYDLDKRLITLLGNVTLDRSGPNAGTVRGGRLVINLNTGQANVDGSPVGGNGSSGSGGRVSGRFTVAPHDNDTANAGSSSSAPAKASPPPAKPK